MIVPHLIERLESLDNLLFTSQITQQNTPNNQNSFRQSASLFLQEYYPNQNHEIDTNIPTDGNCFYHSIAVLLRNMYPNTELLNEHEADHITLRNSVVEYLKKNTSLIPAGTDIGSYLTRISNHGDTNRDGEWADTTQIRAMLSVLQKSGIEIDNIVSHTTGNIAEFANNNNLENLEQQVILHLYNPGNHFMPIIENTNNPIHMEIDAEAIVSLAMAENNTQQGETIATQTLKTNATIVTGVIEQYISPLLGEANNLFYKESGEDC